MCCISLDSYLYSSAMHGTINIKVPGLLIWINGAHPHVFVDHLKQIAYCPSNTTFVFLHYFGRKLPKHVAIPKLKKNRICVVISCVFVALCVHCFFFTLDAGLLARSQYSEGPATGHLRHSFFLVSLCL